MCRITSSFRIHSGTFEHIIDTALLYLSLQLFQINLPRRTVLGNILHQLISLSKLRKQIYCDNGLACSRPAFNDDRSLLIILLAVQGEWYYLLIGNLLLINHDEFPIPPQHGSNGILEAL